MSVLFSDARTGLPIPAPGATFSLGAGAQLSPIGGYYGAAQRQQQLRPVPVSATSMANTFELVDVPAPAAASTAATAASTAAAAQQQWRQPSFAPGGAFNMNSFQSYNMLARAYTAVPTVPAGPLPGWGDGPVSPLVYAAGAASPVMYGAAVMGSNPARTATLLSPARGIIFGNRGSTL